MPNGTMTKTIVLSGSLAQKPGHGGHTWVFPQYLLGFQRLGWEVLLLDELQPGMCVDEKGAVCPFEQSVNRGCFQEVMDWFGLSDCFALSYNQGERML